MGKITKQELSTVLQNQISAEAQAKVDVHANKKDNPHETTKAQVGLGNVDNTSDLNKPISTATQSALDDLGNEIGILSNLTTEEKSSTVGAINEINTQLADIATIPKGNDVAKLQEAINSANGIVHLPPGDFILDGTGTELLLINKPIKLKGSGHNTKLIIKSTVPNTTDVIRISPLVGTMGKTLFSVEDLQIIPESGSPARHGIHIDVTNVGQYMSKFTLKNVIVKALGGKSFKLTNPTNVDGFFASTIEDNEFWSGMEFERIGDSVKLLRNTITGLNIGIDITTVPSARMVIIENNNITANGAIRVQSGGQVKILRNQIEQTLDYTGTDDAMITIGTISNVFSSEIDGNNMNTHGKIKHAIKLDKAFYTKVDNNYFFKGTDNIINMTANSQKNKIGNNNVLENETNTGELRVKDYITDSGVGNCGILKQATLENGWVNNASQNYPNAGFYKDSDGVIHLTGVITSGTTTAGTTIFTLPIGFRPPRSIRVPVVNNGVYGDLLIIPNGQVQAFVTNNTFLSLDGVNFYTKEIL